MYALFIDVMGVQQRLVAELIDGSQPDEERCRADLGNFHRDLTDTVERDIPLLVSARDSVEEPRFVAEFSDSAYIVSNTFASVAVVGILMMRKALRHEYPLRGGIGFGTFSHETSGVRTTRLEQVWTTSSFMGSAIVTAYRAERSSALGLRIFVHRAVEQRNPREGVMSYAVYLGTEERDAEAAHELRLWRRMEAIAAISRLELFQRKQRLSERAERHYEATRRAYQVFATIPAELVSIPPAAWLLE